jgi:hypothetical protein
MLALLRAFFYYRIGRLVVEGTFHPTFSLCTDTALLSARNPGDRDYEEHYHRRCHGMRRSYFLQRTGFGRQREGRRNAEAGRQEGDHQEALLLQNGQGGEEP